MKCWRWGRHSENVDCEEESLADSDRRVVLSRHDHLHSHGRAVLYPASSPIPD